MRAMGMMPAYRGMDDKAQVKRNLQTLETGVAVLRRGEPVGIFPEGKSHDREGVEQVRSGASRMVWQAANAGVPVTVVPIGLNYERKERFRSAVWVRVGERLDAEVWFRDRREDEKRVIRSMTEEIDRRLAAAAENWRLSRMATVDRNVLRLGAYELLHAPATPPAVALNEAIELARRYGSAESPAFVNGVLDRLRQDAAPPPEVPPGPAEAPGPSGGP